MLTPSWISPMLPEHEARRVRQWYEVVRDALPDGPADLVRLPGVHPFGPAQQATFAAVRRVAATRVCVLGPGTAPMALWAARGGAEVIAWHDSLAEALATEATLAANDQSAHTVRCEQEPHPSDIASCDLALLHLPRGRDLQAHLLQLAELLLQPGGRLVFTGAKNEGFGSALADAKDRFGQAGVVARKGGYHAALAYRSARDFNPPEDGCRSYAVEVDGEPAALVSCPGAFAGDRLDLGAAALIAGMVVGPGHEILDLGCGTGLVGLAALRRGARVTGTDVSSAAVTSTRRTWDANGYPDAVARLSVGASPIPDGAIDTVITNPPFHRGRDTNFEAAQLFVKEAARVLHSGGHLYLVANAFLNYAAWLEHTFKSVTVAWQDTRFRVWHACR